jgi:cyclopropane fatty-acyl-phospholipid synthase-like methyltransferase
MVDFNQAAALWDEHPERKKRSEEIAAAMLTHADFPADADLLEFGCGTGILSLVLRPHVHSIVAADTSPEMLKVVERKISAGKISGVRTLLLKGLPGETLPACDAIVSSITLHHIEDVPELFRRFYMALRPGGVVALADLEPEGGLFHPDPKGVFHNGFEHAEFQHWLEAAGFGEVVFYAAAHMRKKGADSREHNFPIFLAITRKAAHL